MKVNQLETINGNLVEGPLLISPRVFSDERGFFFESWNQSRFDKLLNQNTIFLQDNHSRSSLGTLRGLHYQLNPAAQGKLVRCTLGRIFDVAVDIRRDSNTLGEWVGVELSDINHHQLWIPEGFAHGFLTLSSVAEVQYKATRLWNKDFERAIRWDDQSLGIQWPLNQIKERTPLLSIKDSAAPNFEQVNERGDFLE